MSADDLIDLRDCKPENLIWASGHYDAAHKKPTGWHLFQFGASNGEPWHWFKLAVQPPCRAPSFMRASHEFWIDVDGYDLTEAYDPDKSGDPGQFWCHKCIVEVVMKFPHIFQ